MLYRIGIDPNWASKLFCHLDIPTEYQYYTDITIFKPSSGFFDIITDVGH